MNFKTNVRGFGLGLGFGFSTAVVILSCDR